MIGDISGYQFRLKWCFFLVFPIYRRKFFQNFVLLHFNEIFHVVISMIFESNKNNSPFNTFVKNHFSCQQKATQFLDSGEKEKSGEEVHIYTNIEIDENL